MNSDNANSGAIDEIILTLQEMVNFCKRVEEMTEKASLYKSLGRNWQLALLSDIWDEIPERNSEKAEQLRVILEISEMLSEND